MPTRPRSPSRPASRAPAPALEFARWIVWQDAWFIAVDKPAGVLSQGGEGGAGVNLVDLARVHLGRRTGVGVLHRLDRNVSGLVLLATDPRAARGVSMALARGDVQRFYRAVVLGDPREDAWRMDASLAKDERSNEVTAATAAQLAAMPEARRGLFRAAETRARVLTRFRAPAGACASLEVQPVTGRSHQIRVHLAHAGLPIAGDPKYGVPVRQVERPLLHATRMVFVHPITRATVEIDAPVPWEDALIRALARRGPTRG